MHRLYARLQLGFWAMVALVMLAPFVLIEGAAALRQPALSGIVLQIVVCIASADGRARIAVSNTGALSADRGRGRGRRHRRMDAALRHRCAGAAGRCRCVRPPRCPSAP